MFCGLRDLNRREHDWMQADHEDLKEAIVALTRHNTDQDAALAKTVARLDQMDAVRAVPTTWLNWLAVLAAIAVGIAAIYPLVHPPPAPPSPAEYAAAVAKALTSQKVGGDP